jgi:uncharacterized membrane protein SpoIIM required for sporulation
LRFSIKYRLIYLALGISAFLIAYSAGASIHMSIKETNILKQQFSEQIKDINQFGIFINNVRLALGMFIPVLGIGLGIFSGFSTGMVFSAIALTSPLIKNIPPLLILITPFGLLEIFAYGLALSRSGILFYQLIKRKSSWKEYAIPLLRESSIVIVVLLIGAIIEWQTILRFGGLHSSRIASYQY